MEADPVADGGRSGHLSYDATAPAMLSRACAGEYPKHTLIWLVGCDEGIDAVESHGQEDPKD